MAETNEDEHKSENDADGGETGKQKTTEKTSEELKQIADDQRKRAEKAEADLKAERQKNAVKPDDKKPVVEQKQINAQVADPDELRLIARGLSDTEIEQLQVISKGKGISLMESLKDPLFISFQKDLKEQDKKEKAKLGGSNSSSQGQEGDEPLVKPGMTEEEHKEVWSKTMKGN